MPPDAAAEVASLVAAVQRGDIRSCGRLITRIETGDEALIPLLQALYPLGGRTPVIGITGSPGAGKSSLLDHLIAQYRARGQTVAVLAIDPASPFSGGAILGDRIRMARHNTDAGVFIRSMSARGMLGGLARAAGDALTVLDAMGRDLILVETVGVGQNEIDIMRHAMTVVMVQTPAGGDAVQAVKAGILEIGDVFVVNKADTAGADRAVSALREAVEFRHDPHQPGGWLPPVLKTQASDGAGVERLVAALDAHHQHLLAHPQQRLARQRTQARARILELINARLQRRYRETGDRSRQFEQQVDAILARRYDPYWAATQLLETMA